MRGVVAVAGLLAVLVGTVAHGQPQGRRWQDLTPQERERAWQNYQRYQQWPQAKQRALDQRYQQYQSLPPQERERVWRRRIPSGNSKPRQGGSIVRKCSN